MNAIDRFLNRITMYRLVVEVLGILAAASIIFSFMGKLSFSPTSLVASLGLVLVSAYLTDRGIARFFRVPTNMESALITSLILFLIVQPAHTLVGGLALVLAGAISSASKFLVSWNGRHIFNPAALAAATLSLTGLQVTSWWIGSSIFWPLTLLLGLLVARKIRRLPMVFCFLLVSIGLQLVLFAQGHQPLASGMKHALLASPLIFLATIMLTEPATMPPRRNQQLLFAVLVAVLYVKAPELGPFIIYPEVALLFGNVFAFAVAPKFRVQLVLREVQKISDRVYTYTFQPEHHFAYLPGQYMEWTLPQVPYDSRGNRRTFTIASSPTEDTVQVGLKYYEPASMYKAAFEQLQPGDIVYGSQLAGSFTLNGNEQKKLAFIAGGIGITPFRSMITYLADSKIAADVILLYIVSDPAEFAYVADFRAAAASGIRTIPIVTDPARQMAGTVNTKLSPAVFKQLIPDYAERLFYISGPNAMVDSSLHQLRSLGIRRRHIKTDHFSGY
jgi:ferredoxin-NADP reductase